MPLPAISTWRAACALRMGRRDPAAARFSKLSGGRSRLGRQWPARNPQRGSHGPCVASSSPSGAQRRRRCDRCAAAPAPTWRSPTTCMTISLLRSTVCRTWPARASAWRTMTVETIRRAALAANRGGGRHERARMSAKRSAAMSCSLSDRCGISSRSAAHSAWTRYAVHLATAGMATDLPSASSRIHSRLQLQAPTHSSCRGGGGGTAKIRQCGLRLVACGCPAAERRHDRCVDHLAHRFRGRADRSHSADGHRARCRARDLVKLGLAADHIMSPAILTGPRLPRPAGCGVRIELSYGRNCSMP